MQRIINYIGLFIISALLLSCGDIINSDPNIKVNKTKIFKVKADQEMNVIMPLKVGNKWFYRFTEYFSTGDIYNSYIDSVVVIGDTLINGDKWFRVYFPMQRKDGSVLLTNTNLGLWLTCSECNNESYLLAQYPTLSRFQNENFLFTTLLNNNDLYKDSCKRYIDYEKDETPIKSYNSSSKYTQRFEFLSTGRTINPFVYNFVPGKGLISHKTYFTDLSVSNSQSFLWKKYEIVDSTYRLLIQNMDTIDFGEIIRGDFKSGNFNVLSNYTGSSVNIMSIEFLVKMGDLVILPYDKTIPDQCNFMLPLKVTPTASGIFEGTIFIKTDAGEFQIKVKWTSR